MRYIFFLLMCSISILPTVLYTQLTGGVYEIYGDTFSFVSGNASTGGIYDLYDTGGEFFAASSGGGDYVLRGGYRAVEKGILRVEVSESAINYGELTPGVVSSSSIDIAVWTDASTGYTLTLRESANPTSAALDTIANVIDGDIDGSTEEYGIAATGDDVVISGDIALTTSAQTIASFAGAVTNRTTRVFYKVAIDGSTPDGVYGHTIYPTILVNP